MSFSLLSNSLAPGPLDWRRCAQASGVCTSPQAVSWSSRNLVAILTDGVIQVCDLREFLLGRRSLGAVIARLEVEDYCVGTPLNQASRSAKESDPEAAAAAKAQAAATGATGTSYNRQASLTTPQALRISRDLGVGHAGTLLHVCVAQAKSSFVTVGWYEPGVYSGKKSEGDSSSDDIYLYATTSCGRVLIWAVRESQNTCTLTLTKAIEAQNLIGLAPFGVDVRTVIQGTTCCGFTADPDVIITSYNEQLVVWNLGRIKAAEQADGEKSGTSKKRGKKDGEDASASGDKAGTKKQKTAKGQAKAVSGSDVNEVMIAKNEKQIISNVKFTVPITALSCFAGEVMIGLASGRVIGFSQDYTSQILDRAAKQRDSTDAADESLTAPISGYKQCFVYKPESTPNTAKFRIRQRRRGPVQILRRTCADLLAIGIQDSVILMQKTLVDSKKKNKKTGEVEVVSSTKWVILLEYIQSSLIVDLCVDLTQGLFISTDAHSVACFWTIETREESEVPVDDFQKKVSIKSAAEDPPQLSLEKLKISSPPKNLNPNLLKAQSVRSNAMQSVVSHDGAAGRINPGSKNLLLVQKAPQFYRAAPEPSEYVIIGNQPTTYRPRADALLTCCGLAISPGGRCLVALTVANKEEAINYRRLQSAGSSLSEVWVAPVPQRRLLRPGQKSIPILKLENSDLLDGLAASETSVSSPSSSTSDKEGNSSQLCQYFVRHLGGGGEVMTTLFASLISLLAKDIMSPLGAESIRFLVQLAHENQRTRPGNKGGSTQSCDRQFSSFPSKLQMLDVAYCFLQADVNPTLSSSQREQRDREERESWLSGAAAAKENPLDLRATLMQATAKSSGGDGLAVSKANVISDEEWGLVSQVCDVVAGDKAVASSLKSQLLNAYRVICQIAGFDSVKNFRRDLHQFFVEKKNLPCGLCKRPLRLARAFDSYRCDNGHQFPACQITGEAILFQAMKRCVLCLRYSLKDAGTAAGLSDSSTCAFCLGRLVDCT